MKQWIYNGSMAAGVASTAGGVALQFGLGYGLIALGLQLVALTVFSARVAARAVSG